ncbi:amino acid ABC transporter ATP-binding protein [Enterococcus alishanensis]|uniref:amino acid ABC transporter ATP-binding protein n=1 Tax=Enterococcus alishanensis TaxID=1303817 RepID=UPI001FE5CF5D|nr:amino acid ABC transporter ATP-binding protein [Enterococcus alishanensis]
MSILEIKHLNKDFGPDKAVLKDISVAIESQTVTCILGPSGAGKSTFLRCINQLEAPSEGEIFYNRENTIATEYDVRKMREEIGMVFQSFHLFPLKTVLENVLMPLEIVKKMYKPLAKKQALAMLEKVGLADKADDFPDELSGGQKQRVAIARSLAMDPKIMLFDEPTSALDPELVGDVLDVMQDLAEEGKTMIIVTHEMGFAREVANRILFMVDGEIVEDSSPERFFDCPATERGQSFIKRSLK